MNPTAAAPPAEPAVPAAENLAAILMGEVAAMQKALKDDQELLVLCNAGGEQVRVLDIFAPSPKVLVVTGLNAEKALTRVISPADAVQLVCRPVAAAVAGKPSRIRFITPKPITK
ncbi:hypothetical protein F183_A46820 [Bryobacterales bacterium F-183]|nr:hypothetical protein F183_A46820 [Bryobacterales bacterium F-183]